MPTSGASASGAAAAAWPGHLSAPIHHLAGELLLQRRLHLAPAGRHGRAIVVDQRHQGGGIGLLAERTDRPTGLVRGHGVGKSRVADELSLRHRLRIEVEVNADHAVRAAFAGEHHHGTACLECGAADDHGVRRLAAVFRTGDLDRGGADRERGGHGLGNALHGSGGGAVGGGKRGFARRWKRHERRGLLAREVGALEEELAPRGHQIGQGLPCLSVGGFALGADGRGLRVLQARPAVEERRQPKGRRPPRLPPRGAGLGDGGMGLGQGLVGQQLTEHPCRARWVGARHGPDPAERLGRHEPEGIGVERGFQGLQRLSVGTCRRGDAIVGRAVYGLGQGGGQCLAIGRKCAIRGGPLLGAEVCRPNGVLNVGRQRRRQHPIGCRAHGHAALQGQSLALERLALVGADDRRERRAKLIELPAEGGALGPARVGPTGLCLWRAIQDPARADRTVGLGLGGEHLGLRIVEERRGDLALGVVERQLRHQAVELAGRHHGARPLVPAQHELGAAGCGDG